MAKSKVEYTKVGDGFVYNTWYGDGATVKLRPGQEKYLALSGVIKKKAADTSTPVETSVVADVASDTKVDPKD
jgi:hypothetical protein